MIVLSAEMCAKPGLAKALETQLLTMIAPTQQEAGTLAYTLNRGSEDEGHFFFYEKYRDAEAFAAHMATAHLHAMMARIEPLLAEPARLRQFEEVAAISGR